MYGGIAIAWALDFTWPAVPGRTVVEVTYEVYATLANNQSVAFRETSGGSVVKSVTNDSGATRTDWWRWTTQTAAYMDADFAVGLSGGTSA